MFLFLTFACVIIVFGTIGSRRVRTEKTYLTADKKIGFFPLTATLVMTEFNTSTLIAFTSLGYLAGVWAASLALVFFVGLLFYAGTVARHYQKLQVYSLSAIFEKKYGRSVALCSSALLLLAMAGFSATYVKSMTLLMQPLFASVPPSLLSVCLCLAVLGVALRGGLGAVVRADVLGFVLTVCVFVGLAYFASGYFIENSVQWPTYSQLTQQGAPILPPKFIVSLIVLTMLTYILAPWYGQKLFAAKTNKVATSSVVAAAVIVFVLYAGGIVLTALFAQTNAKLSNPELAFSSLVSAVVPEHFLGLTFGFFFLAATTTLVGVWNAMTTLLLNDFFPKQKQQGVGRSMKVMCLCALVSVLLGNFAVDSIFQNMILANIPIFAMSFALLGAFYWPKANKQGALVSMFLGVAWGVFCFMYYGQEGLYTWYWAIGGVPIVFGSGIVASLFGGKHA